jgi:hypothetical protein
LGFCEVAFVVAVVIACANTLAMISPEVSPAKKPNASRKSTMAFGLFITDPLG